MGVALHPHSRVLPHGASGHGHGNVPDTTGGPEYILAFRKCQAHSRGGCVHGGVGELPSSSTAYLAATPGAPENHNRIIGATAVEPRHDLTAGNGDLSRYAQSSPVLRFWS